jgi:hypothetical protein
MELVKATSSVLASGAPSQVFCRSRHTRRQLRSPGTHELWGEDSVPAQCCQGRANVDSIGVDHDIVLVEVRRAQKIQPLLLRGVLSAAVVREDYRSRSGGPIVGRKPEQVTTVAYRHVIRLLKFDGMVRRTASRRQGLGQLANETGADKGNNRNNLHGSDICTKQEQSESCRGFAQGSTRPISRSWRGRLSLHCCPLLPAALCAKMDRDVMTSFSGPSGPRRIITGPKVRRQQPRGCISPSSITSPSSPIPAPHPRSGVVSPVLTPWRRCCIGDKSQPAGYPPRQVTVTFALCVNLAGDNHIQTFH